MSEGRRSSAPAPRAGPDGGDASGSAGAEIGLLIYPGCQAAMVQGLTDMLMTASTFSVAHRGPGLRLSHWELGEARTLDRSFDSDPGGGGHPAVIVIPGRLSGPVDAGEAAPFVGWLKRHHARGAVLASNCGGTFLLAETGLLQGRPATTHWKFADLLRSRFGNIRVEADKMLIDDGDLVTAGGLMAWTDLALRLIDRLLGPIVMVETSRFFLVDIGEREQRHYGVFAPRYDHGDAAVLEVQRWLQTVGPKAVGVADMALRAGLAERTFLRRFRSSTRMRPTEYVQRMRVEKARELLQFTKQTVDQIAWTVGYGDTTAFRRVFHRLVGLSPGDYRRRFGASRG